MVCLGPSLLSIRCRWLEKTKKTRCRVFLEAVTTSTGVFFSAFRVALRVDERLGFEKTDRYYEIIARESQCRYSSMKHTAGALRNRIA